MLDSSHIKSANSTLLTLLLALSIFFSGASSLINEFILSSISTMILGNSVVQFSITIGLMLFAMGVGGFTQQFVNDKNLINKFIILELLLAIIGGFSPIAIYSAFTYIPNHFDLIHYCFIFMIGFLIGFEIPFIIRMKESYSKNLKNSLSIIFSGDYLGAFIGTLIWVFVLLKNFPLTESSFIVSGSNLLIAVITYLYLSNHKSQLKIFQIGYISKYINIIMIISVISLLLFGFFNNRDWSISLEQKIYPDNVIYSETTKYQHLTLTHKKELDEYRLYINGNVQFSSLDENIYHEMLVHPIMQMQNNKTDLNVLIIGGGDGMAVRELKKYNNIKAITLVDLDPDMIQFAKTNSIMKKLNHNSLSNINIKYINKDSDNLIEYSEKNETIALFNAIHIDADKFFRIINTQLYDIIIVDLPDPSTIELVKLYSKEFFIKIKNSMREDSLMVIQSTSPYHAKNSYLTIGNTIKATGLHILPYHQNVPSFGEWGWYIASKHKREISIDTFIEDTTYITPELFKASLVFSKNYFKDISKYKINTWMNPVLLEVYTENSWLTY